MTNKVDKWAGEIEEILATAKAKVTETLNATTVAPGSKEIELTHTGEFKDGDVMSVQIESFAGHPLYKGTVKGYKLQIDREIPYKIDVGTRISLLAYPEATQSIKQLLESAYKEGAEEALETVRGEPGELIPYAGWQDNFGAGLRYMYERIDAQLKATHSKTSREGK